MSIPEKDTNGDLPTDDLEQAETKVVEVRLEWGSSEDLETIYVNNLSINHAGSEFYLTFGEFVSPLILNPDEAPELLEIKPKVRFAISPTAMKNIARAINENLKKYEKHRGDK